MALGTRILVVEDDAGIAQFLELGLGYEGYQVVLASSAEDALRLADADPPQVVILDWMLPGLDGLAACRRLRARGSPAILMLTARDGVDDRVAGLDAGADDYLVKPFHFAELLARVRALERRRGRALDAPVEVGGLTLRPRGREAERDGRRLTLTPREFDLLQLFMEHPDIVLSKAQIVEQIWGYDFAGDENIVEVYVGYLRDKLGDRPPRLIETVRGVGYALRAREA